MTTAPSTPTTRLKESTRDLARLQQLYNPSDELLWVFFNARVLMDQPIAIDDFVQEAYTSTATQGQNINYVV